MQVRVRGSRVVAKRIEGTEWSMSRRKKKRSCGSMHKIKTKKRQELVWSGLVPHACVHIPNSPVLLGNPRTGGTRKWGIKGNEGPGDETKTRKRCRHTRQLQQLRGSIRSSTKNDFLLRFDFITLITHCKLYARNDVRFAGTRERKFRHVCV